MGADAARAAAVAVREAIRGALTAEAAEAETAVLERLLDDVDTAPADVGEAALASWRSADGGSAVRVAEVIYAERRFEYLPVLADALEEAGCGDAEVLGHLRGPGPHVRGCWALDLVLGLS
jgi:hypothetical protein